MDILIARTKHIAVLLPKSTKGEEFIKNEVGKGGETALTINVEFVKDMEEELTKLGLIFEVR